jgi:hypothetical protein
VIPGRIQFFFKNKKHIFLFFCIQINIIRFFSNIWRFFAERALTGCKKCPKRAETCEKRKYYILIYKGYKDEYNVLKPTPNKESSYTGGTTNYLNFIDLFYHFSMSSYSEKFSRQIFFGLF